MMETTVYGKFILAGEHAVLRGCPALVFPVFDRSLQLKFEDDGTSLSADFQGDHGGEMRLLFWGVMEKALEMTGRKRQDVLGHFEIKNNVPVGAGLGASATLCVAVGRWFQWKGWIAEPEILEFCRQLENLFHGESSGADIAVAISGRGIHYERNGERYTVDAKWSPDWYLSYSGKRGVTAECISKVKGLWQQDAKLGEKIDRDMREAVRMAEQALVMEDAEKGFDLLADSINRARSCFEHWGLASGEAGQHLQMLMNNGAYAVKPTGSGDGGYALSLWRTPPPAELRSQLISLKAPIDI